MNKIYSLVLILLIVILTISSYFFIKEIAENKKENELFEELQEVVQEEEKTIDQNQITDNFKNETSNLSSKNVGNYNLESILKINTDIIGWIKIDGTNINYPVMQNGDFYLNRNVYKNYSSSGTPYLAEHCNLKTSDNLIIYGHHMKNNTMFSNLDNYKNYNYYKNHKYIKFYTLEDNKTMKIQTNKIILTRTEYTIMKELLLNPSKVVTKTRLLDLMSIDSENCDESSLKVHISNIRKKIRKITQVEYLEAVWGIGFKIKE